MSTGIKVADECVKANQDLKLGKNKYIIFKIAEDSHTIVVEKTSDDKDYEVFLSDLPDSHPRWAVCNFQYQNREGDTRGTNVFYSWYPDSANIKQRMLYNASQDALRVKLTGIAHEMRCADNYDVDYEAVLEKVTK